MLIFGDSFVGLPQSPSARGPKSIDPVAVAVGLPEVLHLFAGADAHP